MKAEDSRRLEDRVDFETLKRWLEIKLNMKLAGLEYYLDSKGQVNWIGLTDIHSKITMLSCNLDENEKLQLKDDCNLQEMLERIFVKRFMSKRLDVQRTCKFSKYILSVYPEYQFAKDFSDSQVELELSILGL